MVGAFDQGCRVAEWCLLAPDAVILAAPEEVDDWSGLATIARIIASPQKHPQRIDADWMSQQDVRADFAAVDAPPATVFVTGAP